MPPPNGQLLLGSVLLASLVLAPLSNARALDRQESPSAAKCIKSTGRAGAASNSRVAPLKLNYSLIECAHRQRATSLDLTRQRQSSKSRNAARQMMGERNVWPAAIATSRSTTRRESVAGGGGSILTTLIASLPTLALGNFQFRAAQPPPQPLSNSPKHSVIGNQRGPSHDNIIVVNVFSNNF